ncbi:MAG: GEVED domain-containing protein, partial [Flavobacterium sp.]|nr:GEVED domain-containing protein [Flavobacterium sp.]
MSKNYKTLGKGRDVWLKKMKKNCDIHESITLFKLLLLLLFFFSFQGFSQSASQYGFAASTGSSLDPMSGASNIGVAANDDTPYAATNIGFTFAFEGVNFTQFSASPDGFIRFGGTTATSQFSNDLASTTNIPKLAPYWDDLALGGAAGGGYIKTVLLGSSPNQIRVIEWNVTVPRSTSGTANSKFQIWLYETTNVVEFRYGAMGTASMSASIGMKGATTFQSITIPANTSNTSTVNNSNSAQPVNGTMFTFTPPPPCTGTPTPGTIPATAFVCAGGSSGVSLTASGYTGGVSGITFQWEESDDNNVGDPWANAVGGSGATTASYTTPVLASTRYYRLKVTCGPSTLFDYTNTSTVSVGVCTFDTTVTTGATYTSIMPANGGSGTVFPGWINTSGDDNSSTTVSLTGTTFQYQGATVAGFQASSNGWMTFNTANTSTAFTNSLTSTSQNRVLAPFWDDLVMTGQNFANKDTSMRYQVSGTLGSGTAVITVEWAGLERFNIPGPNLNFQVKLYESDNHIEFIYGDFQGFDGTVTSNYSFSVGYNGSNPAGTTAIDRFAQQTVNANHFSAATDPATLFIMPDCFSKITLTPGTYTGLTSAPAIPIPSNNEAVGATTLTVLGSPATQFCGTYYTSRGATDSGAGQACATTAGFQDDDVWFKFTTTAANDYTIKLRNSPLYDGVLQLLDATLTPITCVNATGASLIETINATGLTSGGTTYYIRVFHNGTTIGTSSGQFSLSVSEVIAPPTNDNIATATSLTVNTTCTTTHSQVPNTLAATASPTTPAACNTADDDVWYSFVATSDLNTITVQSESGYNASVQVLSSSDNTPTGTLTQMTCVNATGTGSLETYSGPFVLGNTYFVRVYHALTGAGSGNFTICVTAPVPACTTNSSPANLAIGISMTPTFTWAAAADATNYDLYIGTSSGTETLFGNSLTTSFTVTTPALLAATNYFWYVVPKNGNGSAVCGVANETSFTTVSCSVPTNVITSNVTFTSADFSWDASPSAPADGYQWEVRSSGTPGSGATGLAGSGSTLTATLNASISGLTSDTTYSIYVRSVCDLGTSLFSTWTSAVTFFTGYCTTSYTSGDGLGDEITNVTLGTLNNTTGASAAPYYTYYSAVPAPTVVQGVSYPVSISFGTDGNQFAAVWIDYDHSNTFDASEGVVSTTTAGASGTKIITINVPLGATTGTTRMRVRGGEDTQLTTGQACGASSSGFGETEDYNINITATTACSGTPDPGNTTSTATSVCSGVNFTLGTQNTTTDTGISYQWESADDAAFTVNVTALGTNGTQITNQSTAKYYRVTVTCSNGGGIGVSNPILVNINPFYNCYPAVYASSASDEEISNVTVGTLNNSSDCISVAPGAGSILGRYSNFTAVTAPNLEQLQTINFSLTQTTCNSNFGDLFQIYVDFNQNGSYAEANEKVYTQATTVSGNRTVTGSFVIPIDAVPGITGMRVVDVEGGSAANNYTTTAYTFGETEDYTVNIVATSPCAGTPNPGNTLSTETATCAGSNFTLSAQNATAGSGVTYQWESADDAAFTTNVVALGTSTTQVTNQTTAKYYRVNVTCSGNTGTSTPIQVGVVQCTYDTGLAPAAFTSIIPTNGGSGTALAGWQNTSGDDNVSTTTSLAGTTFKYEGTAVTGFQVSSNGWMTFNTANTASSFGNSLTSTTQNRVLAPFWDDLVMTGTNFANRDNNFRYQVSGTLGSGSAVITVEWAGLERFNNPGPNLNFQVKLYESDNHFEFIYGNFEGFDGTLTSAYTYSVGYNGVNPAGTTPIDRFALQTANANHFSSTSDPANLLIMPSCQSQISFTPGVYSGLTSAPAVVAPINDEAVGAVTLPVLGSPATSYCGTYFTSRGATDSGAGQACATTAGFQDDDVWFKFTTTVATDYVVKLRTSPNYDGVLQLLDATLTPITCVNATGTGAIETITALGLTGGGVDYYVRVFHNGTTIGTSGGEFSLSVSEVVSPPANDNIGGAVALSVNATCSTTASPQPAILAATASPQTVCGGTADDDVWYSFTATSTLNVVTVQSGSGYNAYLQVFSSSDNTATGTLTSLTCANATGTAGLESYSGPFVQGNTYFARVYHALAGTGTGNFTICVTAPVPACVATPTAPANAATPCAVGTNTTLSWPAVTFAAAYDVYLDTVDGTTLVSADQAGTTYTTAAPLAAGSYFWKVIPKNVNGAATSCSTFTFTVLAGSQGGAVSGGTSICSGSTSGLLTLSGHIGTVVRWESSVSPFTTWSTIVNTTTSYTSGVLTQTTQFRAVVQNNGCTIANSTPTSVTIGSTTWNGGVWSNGNPDATTAAVINDAYSSTGDLSACTLTVSSGTVVVNSGHDFTITGAVTVSGGSLTFENNANLIQ